MVKVLDPKKSETILDPACGTAGFLISSYKHILSANTDAKGNSTLTPDDKGRLAKNFKGYDISPDMVRLSLVNLYLHGFADPHIVEYDTLTSEERWNEFADVILANPPFMSPKGGIKPHKRFSIQAKRSEVLFVDYMAEHLTPNGRAAIIVPEGIIFQSQGAYKELRKQLVENALVAVVSLPAGCFNPYSGVKTSILILDKSLAKSAETIAFFKVENDGFGLGAQRRAIEKNDLPQVQAELSAYLQALRNRVSTESILSTLSTAQIVPKTKVAANGNYNLSGDRHREGVARISNYPTVPIGDICDLYNGRAFKPEDWENATSGGIPIVRIQNLNNPDSSFNYFTGEVSEKNAISNGELLFSWSGSRGTSFGAHIWQGQKAVLNQHIFKVGFDESRATKMYLLHALNKAVTEVEENLHGGVGLVHITKGNLEKIEIPLPPLEVQKEVVAEIEGYQKVVGGARAVLDHYRPHIPIDPEWPMVELGEVVQGKPKNGYSGSPVDYSTDLKVLSLSATTSGKLDLSKHKFLDEKISHDAPCRCRRGDIYLQRGNTKELVGTAALFDVDDENYIYPDLMIRVRAAEDKIRSHYLLTVLQSGPVREFITRNAVGAAGSMPKINQGIVESVPIPLPPLATQETIVAEIEAEQALVAANRELITRFEKKIQATLARVWGEDEETSEPVILQ
jgi:type I restriction enzyme M protein